MIPSEHILAKLLKKTKTPLLMGILNVTPDSFSDGAVYLEKENAVNRAKQLIFEGADIIDVGGESTRPGSHSVSVETELERTIPVICAIREFSPIPISIDTRKAAVAEKAVLAGANIINDISALRSDCAMIEVVKKYPETGIILMHMAGEPENMQLNPQYNDVLKEIKVFFQERISFCLQNYISADRICLDPGIGFGKNLQHNLTILANLRQFSELGFPIVLGASRKNFINMISPSEPHNRLAGTLASAAFALRQETDILRVHDVKEHRQFIDVYRAISEKENQEL
ncbi:MAG: dihydropteroate synthase [Candidatus Cloacimonadaceae bacterium]